MDEDEDDLGPAEKTIPCKPEWAKKFADLEKQAKAISIAKSRMSSQAEGLWAKIKEESDLYGYDLHYNSDTKEIEAR